MPCSKCDASCRAKPSEEPEIQVWPANRDGRLILGTLPVVLALLAASAVMPSGERSPERSRAGSVRPAGLTSLPAAAQGPVSAALGADQPAYRVHRGRMLVALNLAQHMRASFTPSGVSIHAVHGRLSVALRWVGYGRSLRPVRWARPQARANRLVYRRGILSEWYANGPLGLEQGFRIRTAPAGSQIGPLTLALSAGGHLHPSLAASRNEIVFRASRGTPVIRYGGLTATDARGRRLPVWLSLRGRTMLVRVDPHGARYPLTVDPLIQTAALVASEGAAADQLGYSVAVSGSTIVAGAPGHSVAGHAGQGAVYVFSASTSGQWSTGLQTARLTASDGAADDGLGSAVAMSGSTVVAGAPGSRAAAGHGGQGAVYVFSAPASGGWRDATQTAELTASDAGPGDGLGSSVATSGAGIAAGAPQRTAFGRGGAGAVYVFTATAPGRWTTATQTAELFASDGALGDELGYAVAMSGATVAASAPGHAVGANAGQGAVYAFTAASSGRWQNAAQTAELTASDGAPDDRLGDSVAISGSVIAAGSALHASAGKAAQGVVYVFSATPSGSWANANQSAELIAADGIAGDNLGSAVTSTPTMIVAGAPLHAVGAQDGRGAVYEFSLPPSGRWTTATQTAELTAGSGTGADNFGYAVAADGSTLAAGAPFAAVLGRETQGVTYVFSSAQSLPPPGGGASQTPTLTRLRQSHGTWRERAQRAKPRRGSKRALPVGTTFSFGLNLNARVTFDFTQPTGRHKTRSRGTLTFARHAGTNRISFHGRLSRSHRLAPGRYSVIIVARSSSGRRSKPYRLNFRIV